MQKFNSNRFQFGLLAFVIVTWGFSSQTYGQEPQELDLAKVEPTTDGFCAMDLVSVTEGTLLTGEAAKKSLDFLNASIARAKAIYLATTLTYIDGAKKEDLWVQTRKLKSINRYGEKGSGSIIAIHAGGDEDLVTFYFKSDKGKPKLIAAIHDEQSALAFWPCE